MSPGGERDVGSWSPLADGPMGGSDRGLAVWGSLDGAKCLVMKEAGAVLVG